MNDSLQGLDQPREVRPAIIHQWIPSFIVFLRLESAPCIKNTGLLTYPLYHREACNETLH